MFIPKKLIENAKMSKMTILVFFAIFRALELVWKGKKKHQIFKK